MKKIRWALARLFPANSKSPTRIGPPMTAILTSLYVSTIVLVAAFLFAAVEWFEPNPRLAIVFKCAILAAGGVAIAKQLLP
jgi:hypothetical protein